MPRQRNHEAQPMQPLEDVIREAILRSKPDVTEACKASMRKVFEKFTAIVSQSSAGLLAMKMTLRNMTTLEKKNKAFSPGENYYLGIYVKRASAKIASADGLVRKVYVHVADWNEDASKRLERDIEIGLRSPQILAFMGRAAAIESTEREQTKIIEAALGRTATPQSISQPC